MARRAHVSGVEGSFDRAAARLLREDPSLSRDRSFRAEGNAAGKSFVFVADGDLVVEIPPRAPTT
jgi:hypothetical protein